MNNVSYISFETPLNKQVLLFAKDQCTPAHMAEIINKVKNLLLRDPLNYFSQLKNLLLASGIREVSEKEFNDCGASNKTFRYHIKLDSTVMAWENHATGKNNSWRLFFEGNFTNFINQYTPRYEMA